MLTARPTERTVLGPSFKTDPVYFGKEEDHSTKFSSDYISFRPQLAKWKDPRYVIVSLLLLSLLSLFCNVIIQVIVLYSSTLN